jgi:hypothetical protein
MTRHRRQLGGREQAADAAHLAQRIIVAFCLAPSAKLTRDIGGGLTGKRRVGGIAPAANAVARGAGREPARGIALVVEAGACRNSGFDRPGYRLPRCVEGRHFRAVVVAELAGDCAHRRMLAATVRIIVELAVEVARIEPGEARRVAPVAFAFQSVTGGAGRLGARVTAAHGDRLPGRAKPIGRCRRMACWQKQEEEKRGFAHGSGTNGCARWFPKRNEDGERL